METLEKIFLAMRKMEERWHTTDVLVCFLAVALVMRVRATATGADRVPRNTDAWTGLRFTLIASVFLLHAGLTELNCAGPFLVLSGAVLSFGKVEEYATGHGYLMFMVRRIARVAPVYWCVALAKNLGKEIPAHELATTVLLSNSWFTEDMSWLWFVSTVAWLYALFPLLGLAMARLKVPGSVGRSLCLMLFAYALQLLVALTVLNTEDVYPKKPHKFMRRVVANYVGSMYQWPPARLPEVLLGAGLCHLGRALKGRGAQALGSLGDAALVVLLILAFWTSPIGHADEQPTSRLTMYIFRMNLLSPLFCLWLLGLAFGTPSGGASWSVSGRLLQTRTALALGEISFGFYLWHYLFLSRSWFLDVGDGRHKCSSIAGHDEVTYCSWRSLVVRFAAALIASYVTYEVVEQPIAKWVQTLRVQPPAPPAPPVAEHAAGPEAQEQGRAEAGVERELPARVSSEQPRVARTSSRAGPEEESAGRVSSELPAGAISETEMSMSMSMSRKASRMSVGDP